ncbi:hypothetical protein Tco_1535675 [Tanacetum coccineum]
MIFKPGQPIPHGLPYHYHQNGPVHMMTVRKRVGPIPTHRLTIRHSVDYSSSDLFTSDDSSETSSNSSSDDLSDSSSSHSSSDHSSPALPSGSPSRKRSRSPTTSVPIYSPIPGALLPARADLLPPPKRIRSFDSATDLKDCSDESYELFVPRETSLRDDVIVKGSNEPYSEPDINPEIQAEIDDCIAYSDALKAKGIDVRVVVEIVALEEVETSTRDPVKVRVERVTHRAVSDDIPEPAQEEGAIRGTYETLGDLRISKLERDNIRLRGTLDVASQRVTRLLRRELRVCKEMRQIRRFQFYDHTRIARLEACASRHLGYHR